MKKKQAASLEEAVSHLRDGAFVLIGGFGGVPERLIAGICGNRLRRRADRAAGNRHRRGLRPLAKRIISA